VPASNHEDLREHGYERAVLERLDVRLALLGAIGIAMLAPRHAAGEPDEPELGDLCKHLPHFDVCDGVEPTPYDPPFAAWGEFEGGVRIGFVDDAAMLGGTERITVGEFRVLAGYGTPIGVLTVMDVGFGGGSDGGVFGRVELGVGGRLHLRNFDLDAWGALGGDGLSGDRMGFSLLPGAGARASVRFPRITLQARAERYLRSWHDRMTDEPVPGGVTRYGATLMVGHQLPVDLSDDYYSHPYIDVELERLPQDRIVWVSLGASWYFGELPR
jgi:hypothetical protein